MLRSFKIDGGSQCWMFLLLLLLFLFLVFIILSDPFHWKINGVLCACRFCGKRISSGVPFDSAPHTVAKWFYIWSVHWLLLSSVSFVRSFGLFFGLLFSLAWLHLPLFANYIHSNCLLCLWASVYLIDFIHPLSLSISLHLCPSFISSYASISPIKTP